MSLSDTGREKSAKMYLITNLDVRLIMFFVNLLPFIPLLTDIWNASC